MRQSSEATMAATVTSLSPLLIRIDGASTVCPAAHLNVPLSIGTRVSVLVRNPLLPLILGEESTSSPGALSTGSPKVYATKAGGNDLDVTTATWTKLPLNAPAQDDAGFYNAANNALEVPSGGAGVFLITASVNFEGNGLGSRRLVALRRNGAEVSRVDEHTPGANSLFQNLAFLDVASDGDSYTLHGWHDRGYNLFIGVASFDIARIGS